MTLCQTPNARVSLQVLARASRRLSKRAKRGDGPNSVWQAVADGNEGGQTRIPEKRRRGDKTKFQYFGACSGSLNISRQALPGAAFLAIAPWLRLRMLLPDGSTCLGCDWLAGAILPVAGKLHPDVRYPQSPEASGGSPDCRVYEDPCSGEVPGVTCCVPRMHESGNATTNLTCYPIEAFHLSDDIVQCRLNTLKSKREGHAVLLLDWFESSPK